MYLRGVTENAMTVAVDSQLRRARDTGCAVPLGLSLEDRFCNCRSAGEFFDYVCTQPVSGVPEMN